MILTSGKKGPQYWGINTGTKFTPYLGAELGMGFIGTKLRYHGEDILRRYGDFQRVLGLIPPVRLAESEERLLRFQKYLAKRGDAGAHRVDELPGEHGQ